MIKLSLNKAAKEAGAAKSTLLEALNSGRMSAAKNDVGHWEIDPAELFRVFPKTGSAEQEEPKATTSENRSKSSPISGLEIEVKMLREQIERMDTERERERAQLGDQIEALRGQAGRQSADHRQALAALTDQREKTPEPPKRSLWVRLVG
jgi:hypothetical protein